MKQLVGILTTVTKVSDSMCKSFPAMDVVHSCCSLREVMFVFITSSGIYQSLFTCPAVKNHDSLHNTALQYSNPVASITLVSAWTAMTSGLFAKCMHCKQLQTKQLRYNVDLC